MDTQSSALTPRRPLRPILVPVLLVIGVLLIAPVLLGSSTTAFPKLTGPKAGSLTTLANSTCGCSPAALFITNKAPTVGVNVGDLMNITFEWEVLPYQPAFNGTLVHIPSVVTNFTVIKNPNLIILFPQRNVTIAGPNWSNASLASMTKHITTHFFFSTKDAYISTQRIGVMANVTYNTFKLEFRWHWSIWKTNGTTVTGNWSNNTAGLFHHQDLIIPAPLVYLQPTTVRTLTVGSIFTARLTGLVANQGDWLLEMEYPNGSVTTWERQWGPNGTTNYYNATIPMQSLGGRVTPGQYLVHIHTPHGAIIFSITVHLTAPTQATVNIVITPSTCGPITINGTSYSNGGVATYPVGPVTLSASHCTGIFFHSWSQTGGGISFASTRKGPTNATLYYNGTITATYG
jgi:hypothetical protein